MPSILTSIRLILMTSSSLSIPSSLQRMILLINSISSFLIGMAHRCIQVGSQCPHYYIVPRFPGEQSIHMSVDKVTTDTAHTLSSSSTPLMPLVFLWHVSLSSQDVLSCCFAILILQMVCVMALAWCCWRLELWFLGVGFWVVIMLETSSSFQGHLAILQRLFPYSSVIVSFLFIWLSL